MLEAFWHPFSDLSDDRASLVLKQGNGAIVVDVESNAYIDATGGLWFCNVGHGRSVLADAARQQMTTLAAYSTFDNLSHPLAERLAQRIRDLAPLEEGAVFFTPGGSEAVETAMKMVRRYWKVADQPDRELIIAREDAYHGMSAYGTSLAGIRANHEGYGELVGGVVRVARDNPADLERALVENEGRVAAFIGEPVVGAGGVYPPPDDYWSQVQDLCRTHDVLLIVDEVITAFGRLGAWFGSDRFDISPDLVTIAKGITSGYQPLGAVVVGPRLQRPFRDGTAGMFRHGYTYSGHPVACAVALENLDLLEDEDLNGRVEDLEGFFCERVVSLNDHELVEEARAIGLMGAVEIRRDALSAEPGLAVKLVDELAARGVLTRVIASKALQLSPPLVISKAQIETIEGAIRNALDAAVANPATDDGRLATRR